MNNVIAISQPSNFDNFLPSVSEENHHFYDQDIKDISIVLFQLGMRASLRGYRYLQAGIKMAIHDQEAVDLITKNMYPEVAKMYNTTWSRVERAMRHAIETMDWESSYVSEVFKCDEYMDHMSNKEFISRVAEYIRIQR